MAWAGAPYRQGLKLEVFGSGRLLWWQMCIGAVLMISGISCSKKETCTLQPEGLRWLLLVSSSLLSTGVCILVVELIAPQIEVHFFQGLMVMPSSWGLYKFWLWTGSNYFAFQSLWSWSALGLGPDDAMSKLAAKVEDIINVITLFTTVTLVLVVLTKALVSNLYSKNHADKVLSALRQESILADLAACHAPLRKTEELPTELQEDDKVPSRLATGTLNTRVDITGSRAASGCNTGFRASEDRSSAGIHRQTKFGSAFATQAAPTVLLSDGLTSTAQPIAPGLGLPRSRLQQMNSSSLHAPGMLQSMESLKLRHGTAAGDPLFNPYTAHSTHVVHRMSEVVGHSAGGVSVPEVPRRRTSQSRDGTRGSSPQNSVGRPSYDLGNALPLTQPQPQGRISMSGYASIPEQSPAELPISDEPGDAVAGTSSPVQQRLASFTGPSTSPIHAGGAVEPGSHGWQDVGLGVQGGSKEGHQEAAASMSAARVDSMLSVSPTQMSLTHVLTQGTGTKHLGRMRSLDSNLLGPLSDKHDKAEIGVIMDATPKAAAMGRRLGRGMNRGTGCWECVRGVAGVLARACRVVVVWLREWVEEKRQELTRLRYLVSLQDATTVHIRRTLVQALYLQYKLSNASVPRTVTMEAAAAAALRAAHVSQVAAPPGVQSMRLANKSGVRSSQSAPILTASHSGSPGGSAASAPADAYWQEQQVLPPPAWLRLTSPRRLLDELLSTYGNLTDGELSSMATTYAKLVFASVCPAHSDYITRQDLLDMNIDPEGVEMVWELFDKDGDDKVTTDEVKVTAISFYQQRRNLALTMHAMRNLTLSIQVAVVLLINCVFLMVVYLAMLDVTYLFGANKTSLDFFSAYIVVVSLMFGELIKTALSGAIFLLAQQPFDIGEEIIVEEAPGWRYMGIVLAFNLMYLRIKRSTDGELVTMPLSKITSQTSKITNLSRSDWKIEQGYYTVDNTVPKAVLQKITDAALAHIRANPGEYDAEYGFACYFHALDRPNKLIIRTFHRFRFNLAAPHRRIAKAREGIVDAICRTFNEMGVKYVELRTWVPHGMEPDQAAYVPHATAAPPPWPHQHVPMEPGTMPSQEALQRYYEIHRPPQHPQVPLPLVT